MEQLSFVEGAIATSEQFEHAVLSLDLEIELAVGVQISGKWPGAGQRHSRFEAAGADTQLKLDRVPPLQREIEEAVAVEVGRAEQRA